MAFNDYEKIGTKEKEYILSDWEINGGLSYGNWWPQDSMEGDESMVLCVKN